MGDEMLTRKERGGRVRKRRRSNVIQSSGCVLS